MFSEPVSYKTKSALSETIEVKMIFYEKLKDGISIEY
jgi:hypothetical protein